MSERTTISMPFPLRLQMAYDQVCLTFERRGEFLSDDDVIDAAQLWTTSVFDDEGYAVEAHDLDQLIEHLFTILYTPDPQEGSS